MALRISELWIYPVKSLAGTRVERARVAERGFVFDRRFMVVDEAGRFMTQREHARMAKVHARIEAGALVLAHEGDEVEVALEPQGEAREVVVWDDRVRAIDAGEESARFLGAALGASARLVHMPESTRRPADPRFARDGDLVSFADGFPFLLATEASLQDLNRRLERPVDMRRFRPNLVISGASAFAEDDWKEIAVGDVRFFPRKGCARCSTVNVEPDRGERELEPLATLAKFRTRERHVYFGQNLVHDGSGEIREGDPALVR